jgi:DNA polymerase-3 subunit delta
MPVKPNEFYSHLATRDFKPVYLFAGEEAYLQDEALERLEKAIGADPLNMEVFYASDASFDNIILATQTLPFMSERRVIIVKEANKVRAADAQKLAEFLKTPVMSSCLVLLWPERLRKDLGKNSLPAVVDKVGMVVDFRPLYDRELPGWVQQAAGKLGKKISPEAAQHLLQESGTDLLDLSNELEKLALFSGDRKEITRQDVEIASGHTKQSNLNQLAEAVEAKDVRRSLEVAEQLLEEGEIPLKILATIYRVVRRLLTARSLLDQKKSSHQIIRQELNIHPYFDREFFNNLSRYRLRELMKGLELVMRADLELKTTERPEALVIEELLVSLSGN